MEEQGETSGNNATIKVSATREVSEDSGSSSLLSSTNKRKRPESKSRTATRFKGVVSQRNGNWGAQIYTQDRIWLGTFKSNTAAAMAYDSAALKLRPGYSHRNFPWTSITIQEPKFQRRYSTEAVLNMIRDGTYPAKFADYLKERSRLEALTGSVAIPGNRLVGKKLFEKELTRSDVGKHNRLIVPKKHATNHFPEFSKAVLENQGDSEMVFVDSAMKTWKFRYCYWKSSRSFVFSKGWNGFVKEKGLKAKDVVIFSFCQVKHEGSDKVEEMLMIDPGYHVGSGSDSVSDSVENENDNWESDYEGQESNDENDLPEKESNGLGKKGVRLFGVQIV